MVMEECSRDDSICVPGPRGRKASCQPNQVIATTQDAPRLACCVHASAMHQSSDLGLGLFVDCGDVLLYHGRRSAAGLLLLAMDDSMWLELL